MADGHKGPTANRTQVAAIFGVSLPTVDTWVRAGCPIVKRGSRGVGSEFNTAEVAKWLTDRAVAAAVGTPDEMDEAALDRGIKRAKLEAAELELAKAKGLVAPIEDFRRVEEARNAIIRTNVLNVVSRATLQLLGETDEMVFKTKLRAELVLALETAAKADIDLADDDEDDDSKPVQ